MIGNQNKKKIINNTNKCFESYDNSTQYKYEYNGKCVDNCPNGVLYNDSNKCKCELEKCLLCPQVALSLNFYTECNTNYCPKENEPKNKREYFDCYKESGDGYYLDINSKMYKKCFHTCKTCNSGGNDKIHNCIECNINFSNEVKINNYTNCNNYYYFDDESNFHCTINLTCPEEYPHLVENNKECIKSNNNIIYTTIKTINTNNNKFIKL